MYRARIGTFHGDCGVFAVLLHSSLFRNLSNRYRNIGSFDEHLIGRRMWSKLHKGHHDYALRRKAGLPIFSGITLYLILSSILAISGDIHPNPGPFVIIDIHMHCLFKQWTSDLTLLLCGDIHPNPGPNTYADVKICHANIRSVCAPEKMDHIKCELADTYDIVTLSETWLHSNSDASLLNLEGFHMQRKDRSDNSGYGGVMAWVSDKLVLKRRYDLELQNLELLWLEIRSDNNKFLLGVVYRAPNAENDFWDLIRQR